MVEILEDLDGRLTVRYQGELIASQEAPPHPGILRSFNGSTSGPSTYDGLKGLSRRWEEVLATLDAGVDAGDADDTAVDNGTARVGKPPCQPTQEAYPASDGKVERRSEGEAQGAVDPRGRTGTRHPSCHGKEVHGSCESAREALHGQDGVMW